VDETYRMLGREHQADLKREAQRRHLAATARAAQPAPVQASERRRREWLDLLRSWLAALRAPPSARDANEMDPAGEGFSGS
jgi:hypothetical protein